MKYKIVKKANIVRLCPKDSQYLQYLQKYHLNNPKKGNRLLDSGTGDQAYDLDLRPGRGGQRKSTTRQSVGNTNLPSKM